MKFPNKKDYKQNIDFIDAIEEWCLDFHRRVKIEPLLYWYGELEESRKDKMLELSVAIGREPQYHLIRLIREYRKAPSEALVFELIEYIDQAKESIAKVEQQEIAEDKTGKNYKLMYLITQREYLYGTSNNDIAKQIIDMDLYDGDIESLLKNIRKWKKDFPTGI